MKDELTELVIMIYRANSATDKPHLHVVFQRVDPETLKMWETWENFKKHEKASLRMSQKFGMENGALHRRKSRNRRPAAPFRPFSAYATMRGE